MGQHRDEQEQEVSTVLMDRGAKRGARATQQSWDHKGGAVWQNHEGDVAIGGDAAQNRKEEKYPGFSLLPALESHVRAFY